MISNEAAAAMLAQKIGVRVDDAETLGRITAAINNLVHRTITREWLLRELVRATTRRVPRQPRKRAVIPTVAGSTKAAP